MDLLARSRSEARRLPRGAGGLLLVLIAIHGAPVAIAADAPRPNIVLIMADDMGFSDAGCYGGEIRTPNLDALAKDGLRFSQFYNTSRCCPTRASLMTGLWSHQAGIGRMTFDQGLPGYRGTLTENTVTIAEVLREAGYRTAMVGKWHLSPTRDGPSNAAWVSHRIDLGPFSDPKTYPVARGFEEHYGTIWGVVDYFDPFSLVHNDRPVPSVPEGYYYTDALADHAVRLIDEYGGLGQPLFLYVAFTAPHWPLHARPEDIAKYAETYNVGWDAIREGRYRRLVEQGVIHPDRAVLSPHIPRETSWDDNPTKAWDARAMAVHAAMVDRMDQGLGRIVECLRRKGMLDDTLILFLSDNGASPEVPETPGFDRPSHTRDGREVRYVPKAKDKDRDTLPGPETTYAAIGPMWANASNTPFRFWKAQVYEGGIGTPLVAHWPKGLKTEPGSITHQAGHVIDIMATCLDLAGAEYPKTYHGREITPLEGKSLRPIFEGQKRKGHEAIYWEHFGARAVRRGDWKLVARAGRDWELYDLASDRTETRDLAAQHPELVRELSALYERWAERTHVVPRPEPRKTSRNP
ncbi:MAG: arylsulfatase [Isosphaeraceae bacterium]|nr:arylsulfatase [Isosphaeraceae bacterium]